MKRISVLSNSIIQEIPFSCLIDPTSRYLVESAAINHQLNLRSYLQLLDSDVSQVDGMRVYSYDTNHVDSIAALRCAASEIDVAIEALGCTVNTLGSHDAFLSENYASKIIHIASHAESNTSWGKASNILIDDEFVSDEEIKSASLGSPLVILSACNTGTGEDVIGEGVMSLNRALFYSQCKSSVVSRWKVDDCSTSNLMHLFYSNLRSMPIDVSLQMAQQDFLATSHPQLRHPYYWAGFYQTGDHKELVFSRKISFIVGGFVAGAIALMIFLTVIVRLSN